MFIGSSTSGSSMEALSAAVRLGYAPILLTDRRAFLRSRPEGVHVIHMESMEEGPIRKKILQSVQAGDDIQAVISFIDPYVALAAKLSNEFCGSNLSFEAFKLMQDKVKTRLALQNNRANCNFELIPTGQVTPPNFNYPYIMKSPVSNGSKDVHLIEHEKEFEIAVKKLTKRFDGSYILVEELIEGPQYIVEVIVTNGIPLIVAIIRQEITQDYTFIVTAYDVVVAMEEIVYRDLWKAVMSIVHDVGLYNGSCHFELRLSSNGWKLIELNPRICGGCMNRMIEESLGINLVMETIQLYLGEEPDLIRKKQQSVHTTYITSHTTGYLVGIEGVECALSSPGVVDVQVKPSIGATIVPPLSMGHRYGYVMAVGESLEKARARAEDAVRLIKFYIEPF